MKRQAGAGTSDKEDITTLAVAPPPAETETKLLRRFIYGPHYIDELVAQVTPADPDAGTLSHIRYVLQDANYNVVGIARGCDGDLIRQFRYRPYGELTAVEDGAGAAVPPDKPLEAWHLFQGLWRDSLAPAASTTPWTQRPVLDYVRARTYRPDLGRFNQRDPNEQALILFDALAMNGQTRRAFASLVPEAQYNDGLHLYQLVRSNPLTGRDPAGLFTYGELLSTTATQATLGGMINGLVSKFAGGEFWSGFAEGAIAGAIGGGAGFAFQASRAGFFGTAVFGRFVEGFAEEAAVGFYSGTDAKDALVNAFYSGSMSVATGGILSGPMGRDLHAVRGLRAAHPNALSGAGEDFIDLASHKRRIHILYGDGPGSGGHRWRPDPEPGKTYFPKGWSDNKIMHYVSDIATDPSIRPEPDPRRPGRFWLQGVREGIKIRVIWELAGEGIITAFPID